MNTWNALGEVIDGKKEMPSIPIEFDTLSILKAAGIFVAAGLLFVIVKKIIG